MERICSQCNISYPETVENFYRNKKGSCFHSRCKECMKKRAIDRKKNNKESVKNYNKAYYQRTRDARKEYNKEYLIKNKELINKKYRKWTSENKDKLRIYRERRMTNKKHTFTNHEWSICLDYFDYRCAYCGISEDKSVNLYSQKLHREHVDHKGCNDLSNNIPSCKSCNSKKWTYDFKKWYNSENNVFSTERYEKIMKWLNGDYLLLRKV